jgi:hypothetical protein
MCMLKTDKKFRVPRSGGRCLLEIFYGQHGVKQEMVLTKVLKVLNFNSVNQRQLPVRIQLTTA